MKPPIDVEKIMREIREAAIAQLKSDKSADSNSGNNDSIIHSSELNYLNAHWHEFIQKDEIISHRGKCIGGLILKSKNFVIQTIEKYLLRGYFDRERSFNRNLVTYLNSQARYIDNRASEIFFKLNEKVDHEVIDLIDRCDLMTDEAFVHAEEKIAHLEKRIIELELRLK